MNLSSDSLEDSNSREAQKPLRAGQGDELKSTPAAEQKSAAGKAEDTLVIEQILSDEPLPILSLGDIGSKTYAETEQALNALRDVMWSSNLQQHEYGQHLSTVQNDLLNRIISNEGYLRVLALEGIPNVNSSIKELVDSLTHRLNAIEAGDLQKKKDLDTAVNTISVRLIGMAKSAAEKNSQTAARRGKHLEVVSKKVDNVARSLDVAHDKIEDIHDIVKLQPANNKEVVAMLESANRAGMMLQNYASNHDAVLTELVQASKPTHEEIHAMASGIVKKFDELEADLPDKQLIEKISKNVSHIAEVSATLDTNQTTLNEISEHVVAALGTLELLRSIMAKESTQHGSTQDIVQVSAEGHKFDIDEVKLVLDEINSKADMLKTLPLLADMVQHIEMLASIKLPGDKNISKDEFKQMLDDAFQNIPLDGLNAAVKDVMESAATKSIIANAVSSGIGSFTSSLIVKAIFEALKAPFSAGADMASTVASIASAARDVTAAVDSVMDAVTKVNDQYERMVKNTSELKDTLTSGVNTIKNEVAGVSDAVKQSVRKDDITKLATSQQVSRKGDISVDIQPLINELVKNKHKKSCNSKAGKCVSSSLVDEALPGLVHVGDHTVKLAGVCDSLAATTPLDDTVSEGDWLQTYMDQRVRYANWFEVGNGGSVTITSRVTRFDRDNVPQVWRDKAGVVVHTTRNTPVAPTIANHNVHFGPGWMVGRLESTSLSDFMTAGRPNDRTVSNVLTSRLRPNKPEVTRDIAHLLVERLQTWDNTALYAKLMQQAITALLFERGGVAPVAGALANNHNIKWINMADPATTGAQIGTEILSGKIILVEDVDFTYTPDALMFIYYLSDSGSRFTVADATDAPACRYVSWPAIDVCVLGQRAAPAAPNAAVLSSAYIIQSAYRLACSRGEENQLIRGLYAAASFMGILYSSSSAAGQPAVRVAASHIFGAGDDYMARPADYNVLVRLLNIVPARNDNAVNQLIDWIGMSDNDKVCCLAAIPLMETCAASTYLNSLNITIGDITSYLQTGVQPTTQLQMMLNQLGRARPVVDHNKNSDYAFKVCVKTLVKKYFNVSLPSNLFPGSNWLPAQQSMTAVELQQLFRNLAAGLQTENTPRRFTMTCALNMFQVYPIEFGLGKSGTIDISREVVYHGPQNMRGWYLSYGSQEYGNRSTSSMPFLLVPYTPAGLQTVVQATMTDDKPTILYQTAPWAIGASHVTMTAPAAQADIHDLWDGMLEIFEPLTFTTFKWSNSTIYVPALMFNAANNNLITHYTNGEQARGIGMARYTDYVNDTSLHVLESSFMQLPIFQLDNSITPANPVDNSQTPGN